MKKLLFALALSGWCFALQAQSFVFGAQGGLTLGTQQWNGFDRSVLVRYHADAFIESWNEANKVSVIALLGYHVRGSTLKTYDWYDPDYPDEKYEGSVTAMEFHNAALTFGVKQKFPFGLDNRAYYMLGVRGEYTISTDFESFFEYLEGAQNNFLFGMSFGAGLEIPFSRYVGGTFQISVHPDFTKQLFLLPQDTGFTDQSGNEIIIPEQNITNLSFEISLGIRFLREVIYID